MPTRATFANDTTHSLNGGTCKAKIIESANQKETKILGELSACVDMLTSLQEVLDDIIVLTDDKHEISFHVNSVQLESRSVAQIMEKLIMELQKWDD